MQTSNHLSNSTYSPLSKRYDLMPYRQCGKSGLKLPAVSLGLWHNFGGDDSLENAVSIARYAFDNGVTHFDLANNYGPPPGSAEKTFGKILSGDFRSHRDELIISTKAGYDMWEGPYGNLGSRKHLIASIDQSLKRLGTDYVDIFYHHRPDPDTPLTETMGALDYIVRSGRALYAGISNYDAEETEKAAAILNELGTPLLIHQASYSMIDRWVENGLSSVCEKRGTGLIAFSPLAQGILSSRYLSGIPENSRAGGKSPFLGKKKVETWLPYVKALEEIANSREQTISQMAISWLLAKSYVTSVLVGASSTKQLKENLSATDTIEFSKEELEKTEQLLLLLAPETSK
ncbi:MAG: aldo/keto reductase [Bacteroidales bacterium]